MNICILTHSQFKEKELNRYFKDIGLSTTHLKSNAEASALTGDYILVSEQTQLLSVATMKESSRLYFESVVHFSELTVVVSKNSEKTTKTYTAEIEGLIFPRLKTNRDDVYSWDEMFFAHGTQMSYQEMKDKGIKNSARDIAFSKFIEDLPHIFGFDKKINLNFNPITSDQVVNFDPIIENLFETNAYLKLAYDNEVFNPLIKAIIADGLFVRRAANRKQKNYWLPGLNAGIPLTPKKDEVHEVTFMFHDIMHFAFPDLIITKPDKADKHKYIISRMISEAMTLVLADMLFVSLIKANNVEYDYSKRRIYPLFENINFEISKENLPKIKELLWANTQFALLGNNALKELVQNDEIFENYRSKYQAFFQQDYIWTAQNYEHMSKFAQTNKHWMNLVNNKLGLQLTSTKEFCPDFDETADIFNQVLSVFEAMYQRLEEMILNDDPGNDATKKRARLRYMAGQLYVFYRYTTSYSALFLQQIVEALSHDFSANVEHNFSEAKNIYDSYINKLCNDCFITKYEAENYKNIYPIFQPYYVYYDRLKEETFHQTLNRILGS